MHDLDRTSMEYEWESNGYGEAEYHDEYEYEFDEYEGEANDEYGYEYEDEYESPLSDAEEMEWAAELLEITSDQELDMFLGKLIGKAGRGIRRFARSSVGRRLGGMLKGIAKKALPIAGGALGNMVVPGLGGMIGSRLGSAAGKMFGLELEGLSPEDQEFEIARRYVRMATEAAKQAAKAPANMPPEAVAQRALMAAANRHAPGLISGGGRGRKGARRNQGVWRRRGNTIVLHGI